MIEHLLQPLVCERFVNDERYRMGHLRVINALPVRRVLGLHLPEVKQLAKQLWREGCEVELPNGERRVCIDGKGLVRCFEHLSLTELCYEETLVWGFLINLERCSLATRFAMLEKYVPVLDNWAVCDTFCANAKWMARADKEQLWNFLQRWFGSKREFEVRFAVVSAMTYFLCEEWIDRVFEAIDHIDFNLIKSDYISVKGKLQEAQQGVVQGAEPYYVRMGVAWLLATALAKYPERTRVYVRRSLLPDDVIWLYVRKARESFRTRDVEAM